jgi:hypothetical protein
MKPATSTPGQTKSGPAGRAAAWPARGTLMTFRSVASRKRMAAARLQARASVLLAEAADFDGLADRLVAADDLR